MKLLEADLACPERKPDAATLRELRLCSPFLEPEQVAFGNASSGAADDLKRASELATSMIGSYGFGKTFGLLSMAGVPKELIGPDVQKSLLDEARQLLGTASDAAVG